MIETHCLENVVIFFQTICAVKKNYKVIFLITGHCEVLNLTSPIFCPTIPSNSLQKKKILFILKQTMYTKYNEQTTCESNPHMSS